MPTSKKAGKKKAKAKGKQAKPIIPNVVEPASKVLNFSFKHLDTVHQKFSIDDCELSFWRAMVRTLHRYSQSSAQSFLDANNHEHRHQIDFSESTERDGFAHLDMEQVGYLESWQFEVGPQQRGRILGFIVDDTFYIVWLDPNHALHAGYGGNIEI